MIFGLIILVLCIVSFSLVWIGKFSDEKRDKDLDWWFAMILIPIIVLGMFGFLIFALMN